MTEYDPAGNPIPESYLLVDFDGTLVDSLSALYDIYIDFLHKHGKKGNKEEFELLKGLSIPELVKTVKNKYALIESEEILQQEYNKLLKEKYLNNVHVSPHALNALEFAKDFGFKTAIVTSAPQDLVKEILQKHHLSDLIDELIISTPKEKGKPHPDIYLKALKQLKIEPLDAIAIEDSLNGAQASLSAKIPTMLLNPSHETLDKLENHPNKADLLAINDWEDVIAFIEELTEISDDDLSES